MIENKSTFYYETINLHDVLYFYMPSLLDNILSFPNLRLEIGFICYSFGAKGTKFAVHEYLMYFFDLFVYC